MKSCLDLNNPYSPLEEDVVTSIVKAYEEGIQRAIDRKEKVIKVFNSDGSSTVVQVQRAMSMLETYRKLHSC